VTGRPGTRRHEDDALCTCIALSFALAGCGSAPRIARYRFTVHVDDNGRTVTGSAVQEEHCTFNDGITKGLGNALNCGELGEAVIVDLGEKGLLFVLMSLDKTRKSEIPFGFFEDAFSPHESFTAETFDRITAQRNPIDAAIKRLPMLVRFRDVNDPKSVELVNPEHLDARFGPGVVLARATIEITNDPVTTGIEKRADWIKELRGSIGKDLRLPYDDLLNQVNDGSFRRGYGQ
jgi:hypothetical protein